MDCNSQKPVASRIKVCSLFIFKVINIGKDDIINEDFSSVIKESISSFDATGKLICFYIIEPFFDDMPKMKFDENKCNWGHLCSSQIFGPFAPRIGCLWDPTFNPSNNSPTKRKSNEADLVKSFMISGKIKNIMKKGNQLRNLLFRKSSATSTQKDSLQGKSNNSNRVFKNNIKVRKVKQKLLKQM